MNTITGYYLGKSMEDLMKKTINVLVILFFVLVLAISPIGQLHQTALAAATTKSFSTNYTLINLGTSEATVNAQYLTPGGQEWGNSSFKSFTIPVGGNQIVRQYQDPGLTTGRGSVVVSSNQPLGAVVQEITLSGVPSSGAYTGISVPSMTWIIPQLARKANSASGLANSQIIIQNVGATSVDFKIDYYKFGTSTIAFTKNYTGLAAGASQLVDLDNETGLPVAWWGSAVISTTSGSLGVISHLFFGADSLLAFNAYPLENVTPAWKIPLLYSRLSNTLNTSLAIQNVSGAEIPVNDLTLACIKDPSATGPATLTLKNAAAIANYSSYTFNTLTDTTNFPDGWYGSCEVTSATSKNTAVLIMYRYTKNAEFAAYEAVPSNLTSKKVSIPLVAKRLANGYANTVTIQNMASTAATVTITYYPSGGGTPIVRSGVTIPGDASLIRNFRLAGTEAPDMPDGWVGSMVVESNTPIAAYVSNTYLIPSGDQFMAYLGFNN